MTDKVCKLLEYDKILQMIADLAASRETKKRISELRPSPEFDEVEQMLRETSQAVQMIQQQGAPPLSPVGEVKNAARRAEAGGMLHLKELLQVASLFGTAERMRKYISAEHDLDILEGLASQLISNQPLRREITDAVISEEDLADTASSELHSIRRRKNILHGKIREILNNIIHSPKHAKYLQDAIVTMRGDRYVIPVKSEYKADVPGILHDSSSTGATVFIEPMAVVQANNQIRELIAQEEHEVERIIMELSAKVAACADAVALNYDILITLDVWFAKAKFCLQYHCEAPKLSREGQLNIRKGRHPLIDRDKVVPIDIHLGNEFDTLVVTGPNTGGKTVTLKTVGLFALLTQSGIQIPAELGSVMPVYRQIFADIGDEQSIEQSLSTFSSHMVNIVEILKDVENDTLVLFDELGAGTDPDEGAALAIEILEYVRQMGGKAVATTHYSELKLYAISTDRVENASCEFDVATLQPTYRLLIGIPGKSNAFAISKRLGLREDIIALAAQRLSSENIRFEDVVGELELKRVKAEEQLYEAQKLMTQAKQELAEARSQKDNVQDKREKLMEKARAEAKEIVAQAKQEMKQILKEAHQLSAQVQEKEALRKLEQLRQNVRDKEDAVSGGAVKKTPHVTLKPGDVTLGMPVRVLSLQEEGEVLTLPNSKGVCKVQVGMMKVDAKLTDLEAIRRKADKPAGRKTTATRSVGKTMKVGAELDVRGQTVDEATLQIDKFIDDAVLASLHTVSVIHGKGTGALRAGIHEYLRRNKFVKSYRLGNYGEGDSGVTIIELK